MSNLTYYDNLNNPSSIGPITVTTYLQWLRDNPYSLIVQQQNDMLFFLQILEAIQAKEVELNSIFHMLAERFNSFLRSSNNEPREIVHNLSIEDCRRITASADNLLTQSTKAFAADVEHFKTNCVAARVIVQDADLDDDEEQKITHQINRLENVINSPKPDQMVTIAKEIHPAIPLIVLGGIPHKDRIIDADMLQKEKFAVLADDIADACNKCRTHMIEHLKESADDKNCSIIDCHVKQHLLANLLLHRLPKANAQYDSLATLVSDEREHYKQKLTKLTANPQWLRTLHQSVLTRKDRDQAQDQIHKNILSSRNKLSL